MLRMSSNEHGARHGPGVSPYIAYANISVDDSPEPDALARRCREQPVSTNVMSQSSRPRSLWKRGPSSLLRWSEVGQILSVAKEVFLDAP